MMIMYRFNKIAHCYEQSSVKTKYYRLTCVPPLTDWCSVVARCNLEKQEVSYKEKKVTRRHLGGLSLSEWAYCHMDVQTWAKGGRGRGGAKWGGGWWLKLQMIAITCSMTNNLSDNYCIDAVLANNDDASSHRNDLDCTLSCNFL